MKHLLMKPNMHQLDINDFIHIKKLGYKPVGWIPGAIEQKTGKINPHITMFALPNGRAVSVFHVKPIYYETRDGFWRPLVEVTSHHGNKRITIDYNKLNFIHPNFLSWLIKRQKLINGVLEVTSPYQYDVRFQLTDQLGIIGAAQVSFTTTTFYPDPNPETVTFDGGIGPDFNYGGTSLSAAQALTTTANMNDTNAQLQENDWGYAAAYIEAPSSQHYLLRSAVLFDTSVIGIDTISTVTLSIYGKAGTQDAMNDAYGYIGVVSVAPALNTGWTGSDITIGNWGTTQYATGIDITSWSTSGYNGYSFNASGLSAINKTGISKFGLMHGRDIEVQNWTGTSANSVVVAYSSDQTGTTNDPKLVIEHTSAEVLHGVSVAAITFSKKISVNSY